MNFRIGVIGKFIFSLFNVHRIYIFLPFLFGGEVVQEVSCFQFTIRSMKVKYDHEQRQITTSGLYAFRPDGQLDDELDDFDDDDFYMSSRRSSSSFPHGAGDISSSSSSSSSMNSNNYSESERRRTLFLIDDEQPILDAVGTYLSGAGYDVYPFLNATLPMQMLLHPNANANDKHEEKNPRMVMPDAIICDIMMPLISGIEFLTMIRSNPATLNMPFILLTAKSLVGDRVRGYDAGTDGYLMKPFDPEELLVMMDSIIKRKEFMEFYQDSVTVEELREDLDEVREALKQEERFLLGSSSSTTDSKVNGDRSSGSYSFQNGDQLTSSNHPLLSLDEMDVLELLCQGYMNKEIASELQYSVRWVEGHLTSMFRKANCRNRTELVRWAVANEFVDMETY